MCHQASGCRYDIVLVAPDRLQFLLHKIVNTELDVTMIYNLLKFAKSVVYESYMQITNFFDFGYVFLEYPQLLRYFLTV